jgi:hypothetical protein
LVVLDPHEDEAKKMSLKLLELTLAVFDVMNIFQEEDFSVRKSTEMYHVALGIVKIEFCKFLINRNPSNVELLNLIDTGLLLRFASSSNSELCAIAAARLHALIQFKSHPDVNEVAYLIFNINSSLLAVQGE